MMLGAHHALAPVFMDPWGYLGTGEKGCSGGSEAGDNQESPGQCDFCSSEAGSFQALCFSSITRER